ncbi:hypothetical protein [Sphingomonas sp. SKA58]|uniref:hypothetical protein n=1 Tax=Sphingomonas sp. (strain SKA58) TaxID=314266 RepID=UPI001E356B38|nr:hypothetical protein [Sphingomonas sp. SKA58]|tara:strand:+ start:119 stop:772 length:654 start_codon:yes stop_codon:yes gene_type:complete
MSKIWTYSLALVLTMTAISTASAETVEADKSCFDVALIATSPRYRWQPVESEPDEIIIRSSVSIRFAVKQVIVGAIKSSDIEVRTSLHTRFNPAIKQFLLFLKLENGGKYSLQEMNYQLVYDRRGKLVWPIASPLDTSYLEDGFTPSNYETLMRPIHYRAKDAWWLVTPPDGDPPSADEYSWGQLDNNGVIMASRGISAVDLVAAAAGKRCGANVAR